MASHLEADFASEAMEDMDEWIAAEEAKCPFASFNLGTAEGREALLRKYYRIGDTSLFEAVSHIWASLNEPRAEYCTAVGIASGTGGAGKRGLVLTLQKFLAEALDTINWIPAIKDYASLDAWHEASMRTYVEEEAELCVLLERYSAFLNCCAPETATARVENVVVRGPWKAQTIERHEHMH